jgi:hypothetical protein
MAVSPREMTVEMKEAMQAFANDRLVYVQGECGLSMAFEFTVVNTTDHQIKKCWTLQKAADYAETTETSLRAAFKADTTAKIGKFTVTKTQPPGVVELVKVGPHYFRFRNDAANFLCISVERLKKRINTNTPVAGYEIEIMGVNEKLVRPADYTAKPPSVVELPPKRPRSAEPPGPTTLPPFICPLQFAWNHFGGTYMANENTAKKARELERLEAAETLMVFKRNAVIIV